MKCKTIFAIVSLLFLCSICANAQVGLDPRQKAILDLLYRRLTNAIDGADIIDGTITTNKLGFPVVTNEVDPVWASVSNLYATIVAMNAAIAVHSNSVVANYGEVSGDLDQFTIGGNSNQVWTSNGDGTGAYRYPQDPDIDLCRSNVADTISHTDNTTWHQWTNWALDHVHEPGFFTFSHTGVTVNASGHLKLRAALGVQAGGGVRTFWHAFFYNGSVMGCSIMPRYYSGSDVGSVVVQASQDVTAGDFFEFRTKKNAGANTTLAIPFANWNLSFSGFD